MKRNLALLLIVVSFVAGTVTSGGVVYASFDQCNNSPPSGKSEGKTFLEIWEAICELQDRVDTLEGGSLNTVVRASSVMQLSPGEVVDGVVLDNTGCQEGELLIGANASVDTVTNQNFGERVFVSEVLPQPDQNQVLLTARNIDTVNHEIKVLSFCLVR